MKNTPEKDEQLKLISYCANNGIDIAAIPNGTPTGHYEKSIKGKKKTWKPHWRTCISAKEAGVSSGVPDLFVIVPFKDGKKRIVFFELKSPEKRLKRFNKMSVFEYNIWIKNTDNWEEDADTCAGVTREQIGWSNTLSGCVGVESFICFSAKDAESVIEYFLHEH